MELPILSINKLGSQWVTKDPFLFCAHHNDIYPQGNDSMGPSASLKGHSIGNDFNDQLEWRMYHGRQVPGFPVHPHRGFETITVVLTGFIDHTDSAGGAGRYGNGDVQWMTAGTGLQHSEMFPLLKKDQQNQLELFQIWLNLPSSKKMVVPYFKMLWKEDIPKVEVPDKNNIITTVTIITGEANGKAVKTPAPDSWAADSDNEVTILRIEIEPRGSYIIPPSSNTMNRMLFFYRGYEITINGQTIESNHSVELDPTIGITIENGDVKSELMLLQGKPINETVVQYGPFVMNSQQEIHQTVAEYRRTEFGGWPWPEDEYVHGREPRFARYADGSVEYPEGTGK